MEFDRFFWESPYSRRAASLTVFPDLMTLRSHLLQPPFPKVQKFYNGCFPDSFFPVTLHFPPSSLGWLDHVFRSRSSQFCNAACTIWRGSRFPSFCHWAIFPAFTYTSPTAPTSSINVSVIQKDFWRSGPTIVVKRFLSYPPPRPPSTPSLPSKIPPPPTYRNGKNSPLIIAFN